MTDVRLSDALLAQQSPAAGAVLPVWPGEERGGLFVRSGPATGAEPAVFVHGLGGSSTNWTDLMALLVGHVDGIAPDLPGFGWSPPPPSGSYALRTHVRAVANLIESQGRGPVHLFGNSLGGAVSTSLAARRPDLVRTLTLVSPALPTLRPSRGFDPRMPLLMLPGLSGLVTRKVAQQSAERRAGAVIDLCYGDPGRVHPQRRAEAVAEVRRRTALPYSELALAGSLRGLVGSWVDLGERNLWRQAAAVRVPTLLIWGTEDRLVPVSVAPRARGAFRASRLLVLPGVGHVAQMEQPETVARAFLALCEDTDANAA